MLRSKSGRPPHSPEERRRLLFCFANAHAGGFREQLPRRSANEGGPASCPSPSDAFLRERSERQSRVSAEQIADLPVRAARRKYIEAGEAEFGEFAGAKHFGAIVAVNRMNDSHSPVGGAAASFV